MIISAVVTMRIAHILHLLIHAHDASVSIYIMLKNIAIDVKCIPQFFFQASHQNDSN